MFYFLVCLCNRQLVLILTYVLQGIMFDTVYNRFSLFDSMKGVGSSNSSSVGLVNP